MGKDKRNYAQKQLCASAGKVLRETAMLRPGARVGLALSGGVDSWGLTAAMLHNRKSAPFAYELMALHINPGFDPEGHRVIEAALRDLGLAYHAELTDFGPRAHSDENRKDSPCFYCSLLRRSRLFELCRSYGLSHLAFGHHTDDLAATFFMNLVRTGRAQELAVKETFFEGRGEAELTIIRPLVWLTKAEIRRAVTAYGLPVVENTCPSNGFTERDRMTERVRDLADGDRRAIANIRHGLARRALDAAAVRPYSSCGSKTVK